MAEQDKAVVKKNDSRGDMPINLSKLTLNQINFIGKSMAESGMFPDLAKDASKAMVKILAGQEIGVTPFQAMSNINIIQGKAALGANLMAAKVKGSGKYDYRADISSDKCTITIKQNMSVGYAPTWEDIGSFTFTMEDAKRIGLAGKDNWRNYPQNMLFARAISNAVRMYAPDVFNGNLVYDPDELGAVTDDQGTVVNAPSTEIDEALAKINAAKDELELTDIVQKLPTSVAKEEKIIEAGQVKFQSFNEVEEDDRTKK